MVIELHVEPKVVYTWSEFKEKKQPYSIALDGIVESPTQRDPTGPYANFDHHSNCIDRISTRSTCDQVHMEIKLGLFDTFQKNGEPHALVYVNDCDEDTCFSWWLLKNHQAIRKHANHRINKLVYYEDRLDSTGGSYHFGNLAMRRKMAWIFEPYNDVRFNGLIGKLNAVEMKRIIEEVEKRIDLYVLNGGHELNLKGNYRKIGGGKGWVFTRETGPAARMEMFKDGINAYATFKGQKKDGSYEYTLGRRSVWIPFDLNKLYERLNIEDSAVVHNGNHWGDSDIIGGSPRDTGSRIEPKRLQQIINEVLEKN